VYQNILNAVQAGLSLAEAAVTNEKNERIAAVSAEATTRASADSNLQSQINQIVAPSGEAPSAAEVQNARIGADGSVYPNLGTAIRTQVNDLNEGLSDLESATSKENVSENYYDYTSSLLGAYLNSNGEEVKNDNLICTNIIKCGGIKTLYIHQFKTGKDINFKQVLKYDRNGKFIERTELNWSLYNVGDEEFVRFNIEYESKADREESQAYIQISSYNPVKFKPYFAPKKVLNSVGIVKNSNTDFDILFGDCKAKLFYTDDDTTNAHNWNIGTVKIKDNVVIPKYTDIIGPLNINDNDDYIGGVHGDERTNAIVVSIDGNSFNLVNDEIHEATYGREMTITMNSDVYDEKTKEHIFFRNVQLVISPNKIHVTNCFKALKSCNLKRATNGGLLAAYSDLITGIAFNTTYLKEAPSQQIDIKNQNNICATIHTIYGSMTVRNIVGHEKESYMGWLQVFSNEQRPRCKVYLDTYKSGNYPISVGDVVNGEFELIFS
jgi:hypothetical protein